MARITFVYGAHENLGIEYLSAILKQAGHETTLAFDPRLFNEVFFKLPVISGVMSMKRALVDEILDFNPDVVAFSVITETYQWASQVAADIKRRRNIPVIFGGVHPTLVPDRVIRNPNVDALCMGEGEYPLLQLVERLRQGGLEKACGIPNLWVKWNGDVHRGEMRPLLDNLDGLPFADKDLYYEKASWFKKEYTIMASRGCPYSCTFCTNWALRDIYKGKGQYLRMRSVKSVVEELVWAKAKYRFRQVSFYDDMFTSNKEWIMAFCSNYKQEVGIPFKCLVHPVRVDREILGALKEAGCVNIEVGIQSMDETIRRDVLNRREVNDKLKQGLALIKESGIDFYIDHILGIPFEGEGHYVEAARYYNELRPPLIDVFFLTHYPKTKILEISRQAGLIGAEMIERLEEGLSGSIKQDGSVEAPKRLYPFQYLFGYLPLLPRGLVNRILKHHWYRFFTFPSIFFSTILPRLLHSVFWHDPRTARLLTAYWYFFFWVLRRKLRRRGTSRN